MSRWRALGAGALLLALACIGIAWLTGREVAKQIDAALATPLSLGPARVTLLALERGIFRTQARYEIAWPLGNGETAKVALDQHIDHGPWPAQNLARGQLLPAALSSDVHVAAASVEGDGTRRPMPLRLDVSIKAGYTGGVDANVQLDTPDLPLGALSVAAKGEMTAHYDLRRRALQANFQADNVALLQGGEASVHVTNARHVLSAALNDGRAAFSLEGTADQFALWGQPIGPLFQSIDMQSVHLEALGEALGEISGEISSDSLRVRTDAWARALPAEATLAGTLFAIRHASGEAALRVNRLPAVSGLKVEFVLPRAMVRATVAAPVALSSIGSPPGAIASQQADMAYALLSGQLLSTGLVKEGDDGLHADIALDAERVIVNGQPHTWPAFRTRFFPDVI